MQSTTVVFALLTSIITISPVSALGINCRGGGGAGGCDGSPGVIPKLYDVMLRAMENGQNRWYREGEHIACFELDSKKCAFWQHTSGDLGAALQAISRLQDHGCDSCGSVPIDADKNDVKLGELTINVISVHRKTCAVDCHSVETRYPKWYVCQDPNGDPNPDGEDGICGFYSPDNVAMQGQVEKEKQWLADHQDGIDQYDREHPQLQDESEQCQPQNECEQPQPQARAAPSWNATNAVNAIAQRSGRAWMA